jgi:hypothetical protein
LKPEAKLLEIVTRPRVTGKLRVVEFAEKAFELVQRILTEHPEAVTLGLEIVFVKKLDCATCASGSHDQLLSQMTHAAMTTPHWKRERQTRAMG